MSVPVITKWKAIGAAVAALTLLAAAAGAGAVINGWRLDAAGQRELAGQKGEYANLLARYNVLLLAKAEQNGSISLLAYKTEVADERRQVAERWAASTAQSSDRRIAEIKASTATSCEGVLREAWGK